MTREEAKIWNRLAVVFEDHIDKIYDDLEHRTCESCKYCIKDVICEGSRECEEGISFIQSEAFCLVEGTDGCNRWKQK